MNYRLGVAFIISALAMAAPSFAGDESTPDGVMKRLKDGNQRYLTGISKHLRIDVQRRVETARRGQKPFSTILGCSDARVPVEIVFDQGFAEVFVVRVAGNVSDTAELASVEYGAICLGTPLVVGLGHSKCGAVEAALSGKELLGTLPKLAAQIKPATDKALREHKNASKDEILDAAVKENVFLSMENLIRRSEPLREKIKKGQLKIVGAVREIESGKVTWLGEHPQQAKLFAAQ
ncbi:MAG TPA: carbonic anhydrase [Candidatus Obscuribacterales bacterium]